MRLPSKEGMAGGQGHSVTTPTVLQHGLLWALPPLLCGGICSLSFLIIVFKSRVGGKEPELGSTLAWLPSQHELALCFSPKLFLSDTINVISGLQNFHQGHPALPDAVPEA